MITPRTAVFRRYTGAGIPLGPLQSLSFSSTADEFETDFVALADGEFAGLWTSTSGSRGVGLRVFQTDGVPIGNGELVNPSGEGAALDASGTALFGGNRLVVFWTTQFPRQPGSPIRLQLVRGSDRD